MILPDGQVVPTKAFIEQIGPEFPHNRRPSLKSQAEAILGVGAVGALIGLPINGLKGAGVGAAVGGGLVVILDLAMLAHPLHWDDIYMYKGQKVLIQLDQNLIVHVTAAAKP